jgi:hypothetical protein
LHQSPNKTNEKGLMLHIGCLIQTLMPNRILILLLCTFLMLFSASKMDAQTKGYYLIFSARAPSFHPFSIGGHAFVSWGKNVTDSLVLVSETYGFYPKADGNLLDYIGQLEPGRVVTGLTPNSKGQKLKQLVVPVDSLTWEHTICQAEGWNGRAYNLIYNNCVDYIAFVAEEVQLRTPRTDNLFGLPRNPVKYVKKLWRKNKRRVAKPPVIKFGSGETNTGTILPGANN